MEFDVCGIGELLIDFTTTGSDPLGKPVYTGNPGGAPVNVASAISRLGGRTAYMTRVGDDSFGRYLIDVLNSLGIDTGAIAKDKDHNTTLAFVHNGKQGDRSFSFYRTNCADAVFCDDDVDEERIKSSKFFQFGTVMMSTSYGYGATIKCLRTAEKNGVKISFDPNLRPKLWDDADMMRKCTLKGLEFANVLKISDDESEYITGSDDIEKSAEILFDTYPKLELLTTTLGDKGCYYKTRNHSGYVDAIKVEAVDTTGCGDAFMGGVLYGLSKAEKPMGELTAAEMLDIISVGCYMGSLVATRYGAILSMPTRKELDEFMEEKK